MAEHSRALHFKTGNTTDDVTLYTTLGEVVDPAVINADQTTGGATLYTVGTDVTYPALRVRDGNDTVFGALVSPSDKRATNLRVRYNNTTYAVGKASTLGVYGICYFQQEADGPWTWARVDEDGNPLAENPNFDYIAPWSDIETVVIDGQTMVKIPKFYVKADTIASGTYAGAKARWVSPEKKDGYHIHPAFVRDGWVLDCFYVGAYEASIDPNDNKYGSIANATPNTSSITAKNWQQTMQSRNTDSTNPLKRGWGAQDIYNVAAINYLLLIELGTPDAQTAIGAGNVLSNAISATGTTNSNYRGIYEWWGNAREYMYGIRIGVGSTNNVQRLNNTRDSMPTLTDVYAWYVWTRSAGYIGSLMDEYSLGFDYGDLFCSEETADISKALIPDQVATLYSGQSAAYCIMRGGGANSSQFAGPFSTELMAQTSTCACRIVKDGAITTEAAPNR